MYIESIELKNFRNYQDLQLDFDKGTNIFYGDNAQGKTNILESVYICGTTKSHKGSKDKDANSKGTMLLLRVQLIEYHDKYIKLGEIPSYAYDNFVEMYNAYHALGGNGMVTKMYNEIQEIHLKNGGKD